jgi:P-type conjugative transfer ATPase TrbB
VEPPLYESPKVDPAACAEPERAQRLDRSSIAGAIDSGSAVDARRAQSASQPTTPRLAERSYAEMMSRFLGNAVMAAFADDDVTEIYINPQDGRVRYDTRSRGRIESGHVVDAIRIEMFLNSVAASLNITLGTATPRIEAELPALHFRGSRLQGFVSPVTAAPACTIRKPPTVVYSLADYVEAGIISLAQCRALEAAVVAHQNILIAGGTNSGKTTFANAILRAITESFPQERIVVLEDTVELRCAALDHLALRTGPGLTLAELVRSTLRASPNRIVVGEVRGAEALELLDVWATGHPGGCGTCHATTAAGALLRLDRLAQRNNVPSQTALIAEAIHIVAVIEGGHRGRRLSELARVTGLEDDGRIGLQHLTPDGAWQ